MRKLGFGWEELQAINPRVIYASISGFGQDTLPGYDTRPSYDMVAQGYSGLMSITGPKGARPAGSAHRWGTSSRGTRPRSGFWPPCCTGRKRAGASTSTGP